MSEPKASSDHTRSEPSDDPKFDKRPLKDPEGRKGDTPENPDAGPGTKPGTVTLDQATGQSREVLHEDGSKAVTQVPSGGDAAPSWGEPESETRRAEAKRLPTEAEALEELRANPQRSSVLSDKGHVTRDRLNEVRFTVESPSGIAKASVEAAGGSVKVETAPV